MVIYQEVLRVVVVCFQITDLRYSINEKVHKYNTLATVLKLIPSSAKRAQGGNFALTVDVSTSNTELQLPENIKVNEKEVTLTLILCCFLLFLSFIALLQLASLLIHSRNMFGGE